MTKVVPTVHVVDDDEPFRSAIGELLSACGYKVSLYETAKKLLETPLSGSPACILLDVQMAGLSGPQLQGQLSALGCRLPIVFISAHGDIPTTVQTIKAGAEDFLTKPVTKDKLLEVLERALNSPRGYPGAGQRDRPPSSAFWPADPARARGLWSADAREASQADCL